MTLRPDVISGRNFLYASASLRCSRLAICCHPAAGGARPPAVRITAQPYTAGGRLRRGCFPESGLMMQCRRRAISSTSRLFSPARDAYGRRRTESSRITNLAGQRQIWRQGFQIQLPNRASASSRLRASSMPKPPLRVRRRLLRKAPLPRASPRSRASARI